MKTATCSMCGGEGGLLGVLGSLRHFRCIQCGYQFAHLIKSRVVYKKSATTAYEKQLLATLMQLRAEVTPYVKVETDPGLKSALRATDTIIKQFV